MTKEAQKYEGKAYAFFDCNASKEQIEAELPKIRHVTKTPSKLELTLTKEIDNLKSDKKLITVAREAKNAGMKYVLEAKYEGKNNIETADQLSGVLKQTYQALYEQGEPFSGAIVYRNRNQYVFRD